MVLRLGLAWVETILLINIGFGKGKNSTSKTLFVQTGAFGSP
jgi:hypothetical protein